MLPETVVKVTGHLPAFLSSFCLASLLVVSAVLLTRSRGGCLALGTVLIVIGAIYLHFRIISVSSLGIVFSVSIVLVVAIMSLYGYDRVANRLDDLATGSVEELDVAGGRRTIWKANLASIQSGWTTGSGAGNASLHLSCLRDRAEREGIHSCGERLPANCQPRMDCREHFCCCR